MVAGTAFIIATLCLWIYLLRRSSHVLLALGFSYGFGAAILFIIGVVIALTDSESSPTPIVDLVLLAGVSIVWPIGVMGHWFGSSTVGAKVAAVAGAFLPVLLGAVAAKFVCQQRESKAKTET